MLDETIKSTLMAHWRSSKKAMYEFEKTDIKHAYWKGRVEVIQTILFDLFDIDLRIINKNVSEN